MKKVLLTLATAATIIFSSCKKDAELEYQNGEYFKAQYQTRNDTLMVTITSTKLLSTENYKLDKVYHVLSPNSIKYFFPVRDVVHYSFDFYRQDNTKITLTMRKTDKILNVDFK